jgi:hypothetical protein
VNYKIKLKDTPYYLGKSHKALYFHDVLRRILRMARKHRMMMTEYYEESGFAHIKIENI